MTKDINDTKKLGGIIRIQKRECPFVQVDRALIDDERLSWKAKGMLVYLLSKPDQWTVQPNDLAKRSKDGIDSVYSGLIELDNAGYIIRSRSRDEKTQRFGSMIYDVYEIPIVKGKKDTDCPRTENPEMESEPQTDFPDTAFPDRESPDRENPYLSNKEISNKEFSNNTITTKENYLGIESQFDIPKEFKLPYMSPTIDPGLGRVKALYENTVGRGLNMVENNSLTEFYDLVGEDLSKDAIRRLVEAGSRDMALMRSIITRWSIKGLKSMDDVKQDDKKFKERNEIRKDSKIEKQKTDPNKYEKFYL